MKSMVVGFFLLVIPALAFAHDGKGSLASGPEEKQAEIYHTLEEKKAAGLATALTDRISISGLIEVGAFAESLHYEGADSDSSSDLTLSTVQIGAGVELTPGLKVDLTFLYEEGESDDRITVDEAYLSYMSGPWNAKLGKLYVPFGVYNAHFINDPLTQALGEAQETALVVGYDHDLFGFSLFAFNGKADKAGAESHLRDFGAALSLKPLEGLELGASFLSDLADTDADLVASPYERGVGAWSAYGIVRLDKFEISAEITEALRRFAAADLDADVDGRGDRPRTWNLEVAVDLRENIELALRYEGSSEFSEMPETQYGVCTSWGIRDNLSLSLEYLRGDFDRAFAPQNGVGFPVENRDLFTAQLAFEF